MATDRFGNKVTGSSGYREVNSYTTADGTKYIAKASNKRTQIIKVDPEGFKTKAPAPEELSIKLLLPSW